MLNTEGTTLSPVNDTEIALFDLYGNLIASDDDSGTDSLSSLAGTLAAGDYVLAVGSYNLEFGPGYGAVSGAGTGTDNVGSYVVNGISIVPEPASLAMVALLGTVARRRR